MSIKENETNHQKKTTMELMCSVSSGGGWPLLFLLQLAGSGPTGIVSSTIQGVQSDNLLSRKKMWTRRKVQEVKINFFLPKMDLVFGTLLGIAPVTGRSHVAEVPPTRDYVFWA